MKAIRLTRYGSPDVLQLMEVEKPSPEEPQVLVRVHAASVNPVDTFTVSKPLVFRFMGGGILKPNDPRVGTDIAGIVEAVGSEVTEFQPGDEVFGVCAGGFAEYAVARETKLALKPANVSFEQAAAVPVAGFTALQGLRDAGQIQAGQRVMIQGAGGGVGTFAVLIAKAFGAEVTAVCGTHNVDVMRSIGADHVIDYTKEDFTKSGQQYDLILGVNGYHPIATYRKVLCPEGRYVAAGGTLGQFMEAMILGPLLSRGRSQKLVSMGIAKTPKEDLLVLREMLETGKIVPAIDRTYPFEETAAAMRYLGEGHAEGKIIVTM